MALSKAQLSKALQKGGRWRRPRHCLHGRQDAQAVDRSGLRLHLLRQHAATGDIVLLFGDEAEALTHPYLTHAWAERVLTCASRRRARRASVHVNASKHNADFIALLETLDLRYGSKPGRAAAPVVLVLKDGSIHTSRLDRAALAKRTWLTIVWLLKYASELNNIKRS